MAEIKLRLDVVEGTLDVECGGDDFETVMLHAEKVLEKFSGTISRPTAKNEEASGRVEDVEASAPETANETPVKSRRRRSAGGGKTANWKIVDNLLDETQRGSLQDFFAEKSPGKQNDQVAVLSYKLKELLGRDAFDGHEIHTAFQVVGVKTPANLTGVFGNMTADGLGKVEDKKWTPNFKSDDLVNHDLPIVKTK